MYNMTIVNSCVVYLKIVKRVDPKSSHHKGKKISFFKTLHQLMSSAAGHVCVVTLFEKGVTLFFTKISFH